MSRESVTCMSEDYKLLNYCKMLSLMWQHPVVTNLDWDTTAAVPSVPLSNCPLPPHKRILETNQNIVLKDSLIAWLFVDFIWWWLKIIILCLLICMGIWIMCCNAALTIGTALYALYREEFMTFAPQYAIISTSSTQSTTPCFSSTLSWWPFE